MTASNSLADYAHLAQMILESGPRTHNLGVLKNITGGLDLALRDPIDFSPREEFWFPAERRFLNGYLVENFPRWPHGEAEHQLAEFVIELSKQIEKVRDSQPNPYSGVKYDEVGGLRSILEPLRRWIDGEPKFSHWSSFQVRRSPASSAAQSLRLFHDAVVADGFRKHERGVAKRIHWYPALGVESMEELERRQRFFLAYKYTLMSHNSYRLAGAQFFGPIVSNTPCMTFLEPLARWRDGADLEEAPLMGIPKNQFESSDLSDTNVARELWGFFNLHRQPFYNNQVRRYMEVADEPAAAVAQIGRQTREWVAQNSDLTSRLAERFDNVFEGRGPKSGHHDYQGRWWDGTTGSELDRDFHDALARAARSRLLQLDPEDKAAVLLHIQLDAVLYRESAKKPIAVSETAPEYEPAGSSKLRSADRVWLFAPGRKARRWSHDFEAGRATIGWGELGDLSEYESKEDLVDALRDTREGDAEPTNAARICWNFANEIRPGDPILARSGRSRIVGIGFVDGPYQHDEDWDEDEYANWIPVRWVWRGEHVIRDKRSLPMQTLTESSRRKTLLRELEDLIADPEASGDGGSEEAEPYTRTDILADLFIPDGLVDEMHQLALRKHNLILQGPPGVGKTFVARRLAFRLIGARDESRVRMVQFHQAYTYEHFVRGYRPDGDGGFELSNGPLYEIAEMAKSDAESRYVLIIDEINRGNLSKILGEAMLLLESDKRSEEWALQLAYSRAGLDEDEEPFYLPPNLYVIGTMNTADRSLALVDYALRRRFSFLDIEPGFTHPRFEDHLSDLDGKVRQDLVHALQRLNDLIERDPNLGPGFRVGHSYFCRDGGEEPVWGDDPRRWLETIYRFEIQPLLREYWSDDSRQLERALAILGL